MKLFKVFLCASVVAGCGGMAPVSGEVSSKQVTAGASSVDEGASLMSSTDPLRILPLPPPGTWFFPYTTDPGHNKTEVTDAYSCLGWTYRMVFGWEQHQDPGSPTGNYAAIGPSSVAINGTNHSDVSADVYLQCNGGILIQDHGKQPGGNPIYDMYYASNWDNPIACTIRTVWPTSWHAPDVVTYVSLRAYYYTPAPEGPAADPTNPYGIIHLWLGSPFSPQPGSGWCGNGWQQATVIPLDKIFEPSAMPYNCQDAVNVGLINSMSCGCPNGDLNPPDCDFYPPPCDSWPIDGCMNFPPKPTGL